MALSILFSQVSKSLSHVHQDIQKLDSDHSAGLQGQISASLSSIAKALAEIEILARNEITTIKREKALSRAAKARDEYTTLRTSFDTWKLALAQKLQHDRENARAELLNRDPSLPSAHGLIHPLDPESQTSLLLDYLSRESNSLSSSSSRVDGLIDMGSSALAELYSQRDMLKSSQRRMLDVANRLGLSSDLIRRIERRSKQDMLIIYVAIKGGPQHNLPRYIALVSVIALANTIQAFVATNVVAKIYSRKQSQVSPLMARMMGTWTLTSSVIRLYCAYNVTNPALYKLTMISYAIALFSFASESLVYKTAHPLSTPVLLPFWFSSSSLLWMWYSYSYYLSP
ncbi:hypothetical protein SeLEV6574_g07080 [Synchytrium endobioticum]|uniref:Uncharacterized protein n=1 Tax=Synchytrium endobioticum TaxID=286115 RepID=A0A507CJ80_9FUNG|nr:hypothetical protein SeLEV6574_g07080 [Synchytrium endobioticum]